MRLALLLVPLLGAAAQHLDLAPFARPCCATDRHTLQTAFDYAHPAGPVQRPDGSWALGFQWAEERDVAEIHVRFGAGARTVAPEIEYWSRNWPLPRPASHTVEDRVDDPWQGTWRKARTDARCENGLCRVSFLPLDPAENPNAKNLPGVQYRRAVKIRLVFGAGERPAIQGVQVFSPSLVKRYELRLRLAGGQPRVEAYNGWIRSVRRERGDWLVSVDGADPRPPGSNDVTIVKVRAGNRAFSFAPADAEKGPMYLPDFDAYIAVASDPTPLTPALVRKCHRIRERIEAEPEQSYERASREIPALDPIERSGGPLMLVLAADASWQKFGLVWGGHVLISKRGTKAKGDELRRLTWREDTIWWRLGTGEKPSFREAPGDSTLAQLEDYLPVGLARWSDEGLVYEEEAFATLLSGPLSPEDPARSEQTPAVAMLRLRVRNPSGAGRDAHLWLAMRPPEALEFQDGFLTANGGRDTRAHVRLPAGAETRIATCRDGVTETPALLVRLKLAQGEETHLDFAIPFVPGLSAAERGQLARLDYAAERDRVVSYWRQVTANAVPFRVPEARFNSFAQGLAARIRLSVTKDPKSGLYMVPAASYRYQGHANEAAFQCHLLDALGHHGLAAKYLHTHIALQGSKPFAGSYTGDQKDVYHGMRVDDEYDYSVGAPPYNLNHGTVLWILAEHYFFTRDRAWLASVAASMKRAADWIVGQRKLTMKTLPSGERCPEYGLLPAGHLEDNDDWGHWFAVNAYASAGMTALARVLAEIGDPDAARYEREARAYRDDLRAAVLRAVEDAPVVRLRDNTWVPWVPPRAHQRIRLFGPLRTGYYSRYGLTEFPTFRLSATRELLYGALILFETGIFDPRDRLAEWVLDDWEDNATTSEPLGLHVHGWVDEEYWFSRGGMVFQPNLQNPVRTYLRRGEIRAAIRSLYNNFVSCYYPSVNVFSEEYRRWAHPSGPFFKVADEAKFVHRLRDLLVTEFDNDLVLAAGIPERWLAPGREIAVTEAPTHFGPVSYRLRSEAGRVTASVTLPTRTPYRDAWLHVRLPGGRAPAKVTVDGKDWEEVDRQARRIRLPRAGGRAIQVEVEW